jgi:hypothetical protein
MKINGTLEFSNKGKNKEKKGLIDGMMNLNGKIREGVTDRVPISF